jgi:hypothetical protein
MKRTPKYNLPIVEGTDEFYKDDINTAFSVIDTELSDNAEHMNSIDTELAEVRSANPTQEVISARKGKASLREKIDEIDVNLSNNTSQLNEKANYYVSSNYLKYDGSIETTALTNLLNIADDATIIMNTGTVLIDDVIKITKRVKVVCEKGFVIKVKDESGIAAKILNDTYKYNPPLITLFAQNTEWKGGEINGNVQHNGLTSNGIYYPCYYLTGINDVFPKCFGYTGIGAAAHNCIIDGVYVHDCGTEGLEIKPYNLDYTYPNSDGAVNNTEIKNCKISKNGRDGITIHFSNDAKIHDNEFIDNYWHDIHNYVFAHYSKIYNNKISYTDANVVEMYPNHKTQQLKEDSLVVGHELYSDGYSKYCKVYDNRVWTTQKRGIKVVDYQFNTEISRNYVRSMDTAIRYGVTNGSLVMYGNEVHDALRGIAYVVDAAINVPSSLNKNIISGSMNLSGNLTVNCAKPYVVDVIVSILANETSGGVLNINGNNNANSDTPSTNQVVTFLNDGLNSVVDVNLQSFNYHNYNSFVGAVKPIKYLYCDFANGSDTTGKGSLTSPFKTLNYALNFATHTDIYDYTIRILNDDTTPVTVNDKKLKIEGHNGAAATARKVSSITTNNSNLTFNYITFVSAAFNTSLVTCTNANIYDTVSSSGYAIICDYSTYMYFEGMIASAYNAIHSRHNSNVTANLTSQSCRNALATAKYGSRISLCANVPSLVYIVDTGSSIQNGATIIAA